MTSDLLIFLTISRKLLYFSWVLTPGLLMLGAVARYSFLALKLFKEWWLLTFCLDQQLIFFARLLNLRAYLPLQQKVLWNAGFLIAFPFEVMGGGDHFHTSLFHWIFQQGLTWKLPLRFIFCSLHPWERFELFQMNLKQFILNGLLGFSFHSL